MPLEEYRKKRRFDVTAEPEGKPVKPAKKTRAPARRAGSAG